MDKKRILRHMGMVLGMEKMNEFNKKYKINDLFGGHYQRCIAESHG